MTGSTTYLLTGDIGGTNSRMSLYDVNSSEPLVVNFYRNEKTLGPGTHKDPAAFSKYVIGPFLRYCWEEQDKAQLAPLKKSQIFACLATAGLVVDNKVRMTNLNDLLVDGTAITADKSTKYMKAIKRCKVINDFVAQGYGCLTLKPDEVKYLHGPYSEDQIDQLPVGPKVCVGAGTGLGECYLTPNPSTVPGDPVSYSCWPSEGGHVEYAPRNDTEVELWKYLSNKFSSKHRISVERVVSGKGLANVYEYLAHAFPERIVKKVHDEFLAASDEQGKVVAVNATQGSLCDQAMSVMMSAYGCETGSAAIKWIPVGGLFVTGGLTPKNIKHIVGDNSDFMAGYLNKGRVSPVLEKIPLFAVMVEDLGVRGVHKAALMDFYSYGDSKKTSSFLSAPNVENLITLAAAVVAGVAIGVLARNNK